MQYIEYVHVSVLHLQYVKPFKSLEMGSSSLFMSRGLEFVQFFLFKQCMLKMKVLTSIFSLDYKHMSGVLRLTCGWETDYVFSKLGLNSRYIQEIIFCSLFLCLVSYLKSIFKKI